MPVQQGDLELLQHPVAQELLASRIPARLAYVWSDGTPRVIPIWFHWNGKEIVIGTPPKAPKLKVLGQNPKVSLTIDNDEFPHKVLLIRGRYFGPERGKAWFAHLSKMGGGMVRIAITPEWVGILDFQTRFPSALTG